MSVLSDISFTCRYSAAYATGAERFVRLIGKVKVGGEGAEGEGLSRRAFIESDCA